MLHSVVSAGAVLVLGKTLNCPTGLLSVMDQNGGFGLNTSVLTKMPRDYTAPPRVPGDFVGQLSGLSP
jgi:hypothetical protein